ncbi:MAG: methyltransferase domain-containing protein, partial [Myxococcales bacterium]|nr:methyltransferase domain-containing protein [Myxococcales bacterium]
SRNQLEALMSEIDQNRPSVNWSATSRHYASFRKGFPDRFFARLVGLGIGFQGQRVVDLGTGTGLLARGLAERGCDVVGVDRSESMISEARESNAGVQSLAFRVAPAEETGLESEGFDVVTCATAWHWFDRQRAAAEASRLLKPDGRLLIAHLDWWGAHGNVVERTEALIMPKDGLSLVPAFSGYEHSGTYGRWIPDLSRAGFSAFETFSFDCDLLYTAASWAGRIRASTFVGASRTEAEAEAVTQQVYEMALEEFAGGDEEALIPVRHRVFALVADMREEVGDDREHLREVANVVGATQGPWVRVGRQGQGVRQQLGAATGGEKLGCSRFVLWPGEPAYPRHFHTANEEAVFVLSGQLEVRCGAETYLLSAGDYVTFNAGPSHAHSCRCASQEPVDFLCLSTMIHPEVAVYPDSKKVGVLVGAAPGGPKEKRTLTTWFRLDDQVDYWDGE